MKRLWLTALLLLPSVGCHYAEQRWNDWTDVSTASFSLGAEAGLQVGELVHFGLGGSYSVPFSPALPLPIPFLYQIMYGHVEPDTQLWWPVSMLVGNEYGVAMGLHTVNWRSLYPAGPVPDHATRELNPALETYHGDPPEHVCWFFAPFLFHHDPVPTTLKDYFQLEVSLALVLGGRLRFNIVEFVDFLAGWIPGVDLVGDDHLVDRVRLGPYWYKHIHPADTAPLQPRNPIDVAAEPGIGR